MHVLKLILQQDTIQSMYVLKLRSGLEPFKSSTTSDMLSIWIGFRLADDHETAGGRISDTLGIVPSLNGASDLGTFLCSCIIC